MHKLILTKYVPHCSIIYYYAHHFSHVDEVTTAWLQMVDDVILGYGEPTYSALASALDETGHSAIAQRIRGNGGKEGRYYGTVEPVNGRHL